MEGQEARVDLRETKDDFSLEVLLGVAPIGLMFL